MPRKRKDPSSLPVHAPPELSPEAKAVYVKLRPLLAEIGCKAIDMSVLSAFCSAVAAQTEAQRHLADEGLVTETPNHFVQASPWWGIFQQASRLAQSLSKDLAANPAARARLKISMEEKVDHAAELLG